MRSCLARQQLARAWLSLYTTRNCVKILWYIGAGLNSHGPQFHVGYNSNGRSNEEMQEVKHLSLEN